MPVQVRQATVHDLDTLVPLFDGYRQFYGKPSDPEGARAFLAARFSHHQSVILLALGSDGTGLGFTQLYPLFSSVRMVRAYLLNDMFVSPQARRQGVAAALLREAESHARALGAASLSLSTALDNAPAQALYESMGWQRDRQFCEYTLTL